MDDSKQRQKMEEINEMIKITERDGQRAVSARELHQFLESKQDFSTWIKSRIEKYGFIEKQDFVTAPQKYGTANGGYSTRIEYALTIDMAKELSMVENSERGRLARKYFIECEKAAKEKQAFCLPQTFAEALRLAADQQERLEEQQRQLEEQRPKVEFFDAVAESRTAIEMKAVANTLHFKGVGRNKLFAILREKKILMGNNMPYQRYVDCGYFRTVEQKYATPDGEVRVSIKTIVYQKGVDFIRKTLKGMGCKEAEGAA